MTSRERENWALDDRAAKVLIEAMFTLQIVFLLGLMLWS